MAAWLTTRIEKAPLLETPMNRYACMSDVEIIVACQRKDQEAFRVMFNRYHIFVRADIRRIAPDWANSHEDLLQDVFLKVWRSIGSLRNPDAIKSWLHQMVMNLFFDELRKRPRLANISLDQPLNYDDEEGGMRQIADTRSQPDQLAAAKMK